MKPLNLLVLGGTALMLAGCAGTPMGPTVQVMPAPGKPFDQFQSDQYYCKQYADSQVQGQADNANTTGILEGIGGTALGAGLGAALGGGRGAEIGAAGGAIAGTAVGANSSAHSQYGIQVQYNNAYSQCMVSKGNQLLQPAPRQHTTVIYQAPPPTVVYQSPPTVVYTPAPVYAPPPGGPPPAAAPYPY